MGGWLGRRMIYRVCGLCLASAVSNCCLLDPGTTPPMLRNVARATYSGRYLYKTNFGCGAITLHSAHHRQHRQTPAVVHETDEIMMLLRTATLVFSYFVATHGFVMNLGRGSGEEAMSRREALAKFSLTGVAQLQTLTQQLSSFAPYCCRL